MGLGCGMSPSKLGQPGVAPHRLALDARLTPAWPGEVSTGWKQWQQFAVDQYQAVTRLIRVTGSGAWKVSQQVRLADRLVAAVSQ